MSRELKFRVWSEKQKTYNYKFPYNSIGDFYVNTRGKLFSDFGNTVAPEVYQEDFAIEQYTGLKDKNNKEIYDGDIVQIDSMDELRVGYVELVADQYCIVCGEEDGHKIVAEFYYYSKPEENCKVIGNIHENPELLEGEE